MSQITVAALFGRPYGHHTITLQGWSGEMKTGTENPAPVAMLTSGMNYARKPLYSGRDSRGIKLDYYCGHEVCSLLMVFLW